MMDYKKFLGISTAVLLTACTSTNTTTETDTLTPAAKGVAQNASEELTPNVQSKTLASNTTNKAMNQSADPNSTKQSSKSLAGGAAANSISSWQLSGAMAARNKNKGWSASLHWIQNGAGQYQIRLSGPVGSGTVLVTKKGGVVTYRDGPKTVTSSNADELLRKQSGVHLPVSSLYYWVRGLPAPGAIQGEQRDQAKRLTVLRQGGYHIEYSQYTAVGKYILPSHIKLQGNGVFIKLAIKHWQI